MSCGKNPWQDMWVEVREGKYKEEHGVAPAGFGGQET
jgi:hypothetical protein